MAARLNDFLVVFVSIVLQSLPFLLIGVFASAAVQQFLTGQAVARWLPRQTLPAVLVSSLFGFVAPVCDCGAVPLARRLVTKGVPVYAAVTFMLAAPVVNPIVLVATAFAFQGDLSIVALRMAMTLSVAIAVGLLARRLVARSSLGIPGFAGAVDDPDKVDALAVGGQRPWRARVGALVAHAAAEYVDVTFFIVLGAAFTAATQTFVPRGGLAGLGGSAAGSVAALMPLATVLSICSEADAFVARAFSSTFSVGAVLAFMTIGQVVDLRNGLLLARALGARLLGLIVVVSYALVFAEGVAINGLRAAR